jgi:hypothetical protein
VTMNASLDYSTLLDMPDLSAFQNAMSMVLVTDFVNLLKQTQCTMGLPVAASTTDPLFTEVPLVSSSPLQAQPENIGYERLDFGAYLECCLRYISLNDAESQPNVANWLQFKHNLWFDPSKLSLGPLTTDPSGRTDRQLKTVSVAPTNYLWTGTATLYVVAANHIALLAYPGVARGLIQSDVMAA